MKALAALLLLAAPAAAQPVITAENPHGHGWFLGDELVQRVHIDLPEGVTLDRSSLPRPRAVDYWLDLRRIDIREGKGGLDLTLRFQNFYAAIAPDRREVPPSAIRFSDGSGAQIPGFRFVTSPLRPLTDPTSPDQLLPDPRFRLIDPGPAQLRLGLSLVAVMAVLVALAWHQAWWPFRARPARPFTRAARAIARLPDPAPQRRALHRAFDAAFGRVLITADLPQFLSARPEYRPLADRLAQFFRASDVAFFGRGDPGGDVAALARDLSRIERGRR